MTLPSKGSRRIVVDGVEFRWTVRRRPTYNQANGWSPLTFVAELAAEEPGAVLVVSMPYAHPGNWIGYLGGSVRPVAVAAGIREALTGGWQPAKPGPAFALTLADAVSAEA
ncbi:hypothetical protein [Catellatospora chokoriensis]|uniref:Uncharacterized protein n=1 Tax=Catellatospora chokoriensis TaxID=310353 RepID=A0A8J3K0P5_9ACTN|nr:hypothetical protein [Catellatospora chokoriensis]GIF90322.1 hypothetical protein Cch02nite_37660 [Catellatospora chokoriensis]